MTQLKNAQYYLCLDAYQCMNQSSRTSKTIKNSSVALIIYLVNLFLQFYSRKIFLQYLGTEILGLNTTATNLLQFLNLAELGISSAVGFTLYKPLHENDHCAVNEIVALQGFLYKRIAYCVIAGAGIMMLFFPVIFAKIKLPLWYAYASFGVLLLSALLGYFVNYRQIVLSANQQEYKIQLSYKLISFIKIIFQMWSVYHLENGYVWWMIYEGVFSIIGSIVLNKVINHSLPYLKTVNVSYKYLKTKYLEFTVKIKQLFIHKIAGFALTQLSPLILYAYTSLTIVALYGNYSIVMLGLQSLVASFFNGMNAGIGDLVAEGNPDKLLRVFSELFSLRFLFVTTICVCTYFILPGFITLWIGKQYLFPNITVILLIGILYIQIFRPIVESFTFAYGLFGDVYAALAEAGINLGLAILLGYYFGLNGILTAILISLIVIVMIWKPYYLFSRKMPANTMWYVIVYLKHIIIAIPSLCVSIYLIYALNINNITNWYNLITKSIVIVIVVFVPMFIGILITNTNLRTRLTTLIISKNS